MPPNTVVVSRPSKWGNPFKVGVDGVKDVADAVRRHRAVYEAIGDRSVIQQQLRGKNLACWCPLSSACHADVLLEISNS